MIGADDPRADPYWQQSGSAVTIGDDNRIAETNHLIDNRSGVTHSVRDKTADDDSAHNDSRKLSGRRPQPKPAGYR